MLLRLELLAKTGILYFRGCCRTKKTNYQLSDLYRMHKNGVDDIEDL